jgi:hypothetical protein
LICQGSTIRGLRTLFYDNAPFADNVNPTKAEVDNWHTIAVNHVRAMVGYTGPDYTIKPDQCLHIRALWSDERQKTRMWDTDYPGSTCEGSSNPHWLVLSRAWRTSSPTFPMGLNLVDQELGLRDFSALPNQIFPGLSDGRAPFVLPWVGRDFGEGTPGLGFIAQNLAGVGLILSRSILTRMLALGPNGVESQARQSMLILISHQGSSL